MKRKMTKRENADDFATYNPTEAVAINPANIGSDFNDFLTEDDVLEDVPATALKRVIVHLLKKDMADKGLTKQVVAKRMKISCYQLNRILDPTVKTIRLDFIIRAAQCVGRKCTLTLASAS